MICHSRQTIWMQEHGRSVCKMPSRVSRADQEVKPEN